MKLEIDVAITNLHKETDVRTSVKLLFYNAYQVPRNVEFYDRLLNRLLIGSIWN